MADWYILSDIPYQKDFPPLIRITIEPGTLPWHIKTDIPYMPEFPTLQAISDKPHTWYINTDIPYIKSFPVLVPVNSEPGIKSWYIKDDIPYMKEFPKLFKINASPLLPWYILNDIPYQKPFPELVAINAAPSSGWYILDDIPYMKVYPLLMPISAVPALDWYILNDIPYMKKFPPLIPIDDKPIAGWYILNDIPYMKEFPPLYPIEPIPEPHYMYYFTVGVAAVGRWQVRKTRLTANIPLPGDWTLIEDLGPSSAVLSACIEADGDFDYKAGDESITLTTTDTPWMAVITTTKKLYVKQVCADIETAILLDTDVEQASLCRGWKSDKYSVDSGLICAYRKSSGVYAKVYRKIDGEYVWETLPQLLYEPVDHVEVKRLNDFRIGIYVTNPNRLLLSERFYIGGTSKTEYFMPMVHRDFDVFSITTIDGAHDAFEIRKVKLLNYQEFEISANYPFYSRDDNWNDISITYGAAGYSIESYRIDNGFLYIRMNQPYLSDFLHVEFKIRWFNRIRFKRSNHSIPICPETTIVYYKPAYAYTTESMAVIATANFELVMKQKQTYTNAYNEQFNILATANLDLVMSKIKYQYEDSEEHLGVTLSDVHCSVNTEQVGDVPV